MSTKVKVVFSSQALMQAIYCIFVTLLILDPTDGVFKMKMPLFALLLLLLIIRYRNINKALLYPTIIIYSILVVSSILGFFAGYELDTTFMLYCYKTFTVSLLILWADRTTIIEKMTFAVITASVIVIVIYFLVIFIPQIYIVIYSIVYAIDKSPIMMSLRNFVGIEIVSVYYKSCMIFFLPLAYFTYKWLNENRHKTINGLVSLIILAGLLFSGTRTNMLAAAGLFCVILIHKMWQKKLSRQLSFIAIILSVMFTMQLLTDIFADKDESSMKVKMGLLDSFDNLIREKPQILIFGQGPGATFDSGSGAHGETPQVEWTYLEFIRLFGIPLAIVMVLVYAYPLFVLYKRRREHCYFFAFFSGYLCYLLVAATNPYLLGSNGLLALVTAYTFAYNPVYYKPEKFDA